MIVLLTYTLLVRLHDNNKGHIPLHTAPKKYCLLRDPGRMQAEDTPFQTYIQ